ncbi:MAG TPA: flagellar basal body-associated protein FliL [Verrucomicrobiae bacterium]|nr:flagellar basal body-associated protein FliL [Verrucomicrobiae bacterium]
MKRFAQLTRICMWALMVPWLGSISIDRALATADAAPLSDATILIIRHAEKPPFGPGLSEEGVGRAKAYVDYFKSYRVGGRRLHLDYIVAAEDSEHSQRSRLTVEPLAKSLGLNPDSRFQAKRPWDLAEELRTRDHGKNMLICWHHREIPDLLTQLGADPSALLPEGQWPPQQFDWVLQLRYDHEGRLIKSKSRRIKEHLMPAE